jgi:hypothetical protein
MFCGQRGAHVLNGSTARAISLQGIIGWRSLPLQPTFNGHVACLQSAQTVLGDLALADGLFGRHFVSDHSDHFVRLRYAELLGAS